MNFDKIFACDKINRIRLVFFSSFHSFVSDKFLSKVADYTKCQSEGYKPYPETEPLDKIYDIDIEME